MGGVLNEPNPYMPPRASVAERFDASTDAWALVGPQRVPAGRGWAWIKEGFSLFGRSPGIWIANFVVFFLIVTVLSFVPLVSIAVNILIPIFLGGLMLGCRSLDEGGELELSHLFAGFESNGGKLAGVGGMYLAGSVLITLVVVAIIFATVLLPAMAHPDSAGQMPPFLEASGAMVAVLVGLLLFFPLMMAYWFAPLLVVLHDVDVFKALGLSFKASLRNIWPLTVYGLVMLVLMVVATLPAFLGWLVMVPVIWTLMYASYKDIFLANEHAI